MTITIKRLFGILKSESYKLEAIATSCDDIFSTSWEMSINVGIKKDKLVYLSLWLINISIFVYLIFNEVLKSSYLYLPRYYQGGYFLSRLKRFRVLNEFNPFRNFGSKILIQTFICWLLKFEQALIFKAMFDIGFIYIVNIVKFLKRCYFFYILLVFQFFD